MSSFSIALIPAISKIIIKLFLGAEAAEVGGTAMTVAMRTFSDKLSATSAEQEAKKLAQGVVESLERWLRAELKEDTDVEFWAAELVEALGESSSINTFVRSGLDCKIVARDIIEKQKDNWAISGDQTSSIMPLLVQQTTSLLARVVPKLDGYTFERDREILGHLIVASQNLTVLIGGQ